MNFVRRVLACSGLALLLATPTAADPSETVSVYRSPSCSCCTKWVDHLKEAGFSVEMHEVDDVTPIKRVNGLPPQLASCHTALVGGYLVEGHVPAADVKRLLAEKPKLAGLAVPEMPIGSPGMEVPGRQPEPYDVLAFDAEGRIEVFQHYGP
jgi:hypothetical protein